MSPDDRGKLAEQLLEMFQLPDDLSTIITGERGDLNAVAHEMLSRMSETGQIKVGLARLAFSVDMMRSQMDDQSKEILKQKERCDSIQGGETRYGCAHLENLRASMWKFIAAAMGVPIVVALIIKAIVSFPVLFGG